MPSYETPFSNTVLCPSWHKIREGYELTMKISACMIAKNESAVIARCINSVKKVADEIILVDTGSTDNTVAIAEQLGAKVFFREWDNDFSAAKNFALEHASGDWILFLDADEYFTDNSEQKLVSFIKKIHANQNIHAIMCTMKNINIEDGSVLLQNDSIRTFRNSKSIRFKGIVHERLFDGDNNIKYAIYKDAVIYHTGYTKSNIKEKQKRNYELLIQEEKAGKMDEVISYYLALYYDQTNEVQKAYHYTNVHIEYAKPITKQDEFCHYFRIFIVRLKSMICLDEVSHQDTYKEIQKYLELYPHHPEIKLCEAYFFDKLGCYDLALEKYIDAVNLDDGYDGKNQSLFYEKLNSILIKIGEIYELKGLGSESFDFYLEVLKADKSNLKALTNLLGLLRYEKTEDVIMLLNSLYDIKNVDDQKRLLLGLCSIKSPLLTYYFNLYYNIEKDVDQSILIMYFIVSRNTPSAIDAASYLLDVKRSSNFEYLLALSLISGKHKDLYLKHKDKCGNKYDFILNVCFENAKPDLFGEDQLSSFAKLLDDLIRLGDETATESYLSGFTILNEQLHEIIGDCFSETKYYEKAIRYYEMFDKPSLLVKLGINYFYLTEYQKSVNCFEKVINNQEYYYKVISYLEWIGYSEAPVDIKRKAQSLIDKHRRDSCLSP